MKKNHWNTRFSFAVWMLVVVRAGAESQVPPPETLLKQALRYPVIAVPLVEKEPILDGVVEEMEWAAASAVSDLIHDSLNTAQRNGVAAQHRSHYWLMYSRDALFLAARYDLPEYVDGPAISDVWANQDAADIFLVPLSKFTTGEKWHFSGAASGRYFWRDLAARGAYQDNSRVKYAARIFKGGWELEFRLPFADVLDVPTPQPGEAWRANFVAVRRTPVPSVSAWSYWQRWRQSATGPSRDGWLVFAGRPAGMRFDRGAGSAVGDGIEIAVTGAGGETMDASLQLFRRKEMPRPRDPGLVAKLGDMLDQTAVGGSSTYGMSFDAVADAILKEFEPVGEPVRKQLSASGERSLRIRAADLGEYLLSYQLVAGQGDARGVLGAGALPFRVEPPVSVSVHSFDLRQGMRRFDVDFSTFGDVSKVEQVRLTVSGAAGGKPVASETLEAGKGFTRADLPSKRWPPQRYAVVAEVADASGKLLGSARTEFEKRPTPDWFLKPEGLKPEVPPPWTPVRARVSKVKPRTATIDVIGREYRFAGLPVPASILSTPIPLSMAEPVQKPVPILAAPIELAVSAGGKRLPWETKSFRIDSRRPSEVVLSSENRAEGLVLKARTKVEFDGMMRVDFSLESEGQPVRIEKLDLLIPYRAEVAELMSTYRKAPGPGTLLDRFLGQVPKQPWKYAVFYTHFMGNNRVGLEWFCDSLKGWRLKKPDQAVEVAREADRVHLTFHLVDHEVLLERPIEISFGLIATPTKPMPLGPDILRFDQQAYMPPVIGQKKKGGEPATQADLDLWIRRMRYARVKVNLSFWNNWTGVDWFQYRVRERPELMAERKKQFDICRSVGQKVCPWGSWYCLPTSIPEWDFWGAEMVVQPMRADLGKSFTACYNSPFTDFLVGNFAANARDVGLDGMRHDTIAPPVECNSELHGCGWRDAHGNLWPSQNLFATREYFKRLYRLFHGGVRQNGVCYFPLAGPPINAIDSFVDIHEVGEGSFEHGKTLKEGYPPDDVRVRMVGTAYGFVTSNNLKGAPLHPVERCAALLVAGANPRFAFAGNPVGEYRGYQRIYQKTPNVVAIWNAWEWIDLGNTALWHPYWENTDRLSIESPRLTSGQPPEVYGSFYVIPGRRILLIVTNYESEPLVGLVARLDLKKLGFDPGTELYGDDAVTQEFVEVRDGCVTLDLFPQRYRLIRIAAEKPIYHPEHLGENLFLAGAFEGDAVPAAVSAPPGQPEAFLTRETTVRRSGSACLKLEKTQPTGSGIAEFPPCAVRPGDFLFSGAVRLDSDLSPTLEAGIHPRPDYTFVSVGVTGEGLETDPPAEFSYQPNVFQISERTPGWSRFVIPFRATESAKSVKVGLTFYGVGTAYVDDLEIRPLDQRSLEATRGRSDHHKP
ncbi:MAG: hypothetical protein HYU36_00465 [Planctomycetes bacterium]|nr:hypothetical protein [Planctomycetota bacterium]